MSIHIVSIGSEILTGHILNTNSEYLAHELTIKGYLVTKMVSVGDQLDSIEKTLQQSLSEADLVITTGGLGSTLDDETKIALCTIFQDKLTLFNDWLAHLKERFGHYLSDLEDQAIWPSTAKLLTSPFGTAPGLFMEEGAKRLIALPGVPSQMKAIFTERVLSLLPSFLTPKPYLERNFHFAFLPETDFDPFLRKWKESSSLDIGIYPHYGFVSVRVKGQIENQQQMEKFASEIKDLFGLYFYSEKDPRLEVAFHEKMLKAKKTFACAESCTGGLIAQRLTALPGCSGYFLGSIVAYSNEVKHHLLHIQEEVLHKHGAVSAECVKQMAEGLFCEIPADYVVAVSGIAGPDGGTPEKPVGTVWVSYGAKGHLKTLQLPFKKNLPRQILLDYVANWILAKFVTEELL